MTEITGDIIGGDYASAGKASKEIKEALKRIGASPAVMRKAMVAAYEAEMNVVIHAHGGMLRAAVTPESLEVVVSDTGPGIPDIAAALREGFSTAPAEARELGFGAGMGLPNIRRNTDRFSIHSDMEKGTQLQFTIFLASQQNTDVYTASVSVAPEKCKYCLRCLHVCPTQAIRIRSGMPIILPHLCIGCTACRASCPENVYGIECPDDLSPSDAETLLYLPAPMRGQFGGHVSEETFKSALAELGWNKVWLSEPWEEALVAAIESYAPEHNSTRLLLPPVCPAVINLIQVRYPSLLDSVAPFLSALEAARESLSEEKGIFVIPCAALCTLAQKSSLLHSCAAVSPGGLLQSLAPKLKAHGESLTRTAGNTGTQTAPTVTITGIERVCQFLDEAEDGRVNDCGIVNLYACDSGCFGSPVWPEHPDVSRYRSQSAATVGSEAVAMYRPKPLEARAGMRLDPDMGKAIAKLAQIDRICAELPGRDCGVCGSPTCLALAEDIVMGRAVAVACVYKKKDDVTEKTVSEKESAQ